MSSQTSNFEIVPIERPSDIRAFVDTGYKLNERYPAFVNQLRMDLLTILDRKKNPFWQRADFQLFLAKRDGKIIGRIAAIDNRAHNEYHGANAGHWGFFDCIDDVDVAKALFDAAEKWIRSKGRTSSIGPTNPTINDVCGLLIDSFNEPPVLMMSWNPDYYPKLVEASGNKKEMDLYAYWLAPSDQAEKYKHAADVFRRRYKIETRNLDMKNFDRDLAIVKEIYNAAWANNWDFFPMTDAEINHMAKQLKMVVKPNLVHFAYLDGKPVGFSLALPDYYQAFRNIRDGKLLPFGIVKFLWNLYGAKKINQVRLWAMGVIPEFRNRGVDVVMYNEITKEVQRIGFRGGELSWILEDNTMMNQVLVNMGATLYRRYRMYKKDLV